MFSGLVRSVIAATIVAGTWFALQSPTEAGASNATFIAVGEQTLVPYGWVDFCNRYQGECKNEVLPAMDVNLTPKTMKMIERVNDWVNKTIKPMSDEEHWNVVDRWDYPTDGYGDCDDYVLLKRRLLIEEGFPRQALLVTVVKDQKGEGHAVLTVKTNQGEYVLDNLREGVQAWNKTPYKFVKRQSQTDPNVWVQVGTPTTAPLMVSR